MRVKGKMRKEVGDLKKIKVPWAFRRTLCSLLLPGKRCRLNICRSFLLNRWNQEETVFTILRKWKSYIRNPDQITTQHNCICHRNCCKALQVVFHKNSFQELFNYKKQPTLGWSEKSGRKMLLIESDGLKARALLVRHQLAEKNVELSNVEVKKKRKMKFVHKISLLAQKLLSSEWKCASK